MRPLFHSHQNNSVYPVDSENLASGKRVAYQKDQKIIYGQYLYRSTYYAHNKIKQQNARSSGHQKEL